MDQVVTLRPSYLQSQRPSTPRYQTERDRGGLLTRALAIPVRCLRSVLRAAVEVEVEVVVAVAAAAAMVAEGWSVECQRAVAVVGLTRLFRM